MNLELNCIQQSNARLGETPIWNSRDNSLYWIDLERPCIFRFDPLKGQTGIWPVPSIIGAIGFCADGRLIVALENEGICLFDLETGALEQIAHPRKGDIGRFNDGKVDHLGRFWIGWLTIDRKSNGNLFCIRPDGSFDAPVSEIVAPNGLGWSPDKRTMYVTDSHIGTIWAYPHDPETGELGERSVFVKKPVEEGVYDGLAVDTDGDVWSAIYRGGCVLRYSPDGTLRETLLVPADLTTSCCFGGEDLRTLFVTSGIRGQSVPELTHQPLAGSLFSAVTSVSGQEEHLFG